MDDMREGQTPLEVIRGRFPALHSRNFRLLWTGQTISAAGSQMQFWAINWHIYGLTHSTIALGLIGLFRVIPIVLFSLLGGVVADAWDRRRVMFIAQTVLMISAGVLAALTYRGHVNALTIYLITAFGAAAAAFDGPARQSLAPNLVPREHFANAASLNSVARQVATIVGPMLAGLLIARGSLGLTYALNASSFLAVIMALLLMKLPDGAGPAGGRGDVSFGAMVEGLMFVRGTPILVWTILLDFFATFFSSANALLPVFAKDILHVGAQGYGALAAASAVGSVAAGAVMAATPRFRWQGPIILWAVVAYGVTTVAFGLSPWFWLSWLALAGTGASDTVSTILRQTVRQMITPDHLRGRMTAANMIFFMGGPQLGELEAGLVANWIGAPWSVITGGLGCLVTVAWVAARAPALRRYRGEESTGPAVES